MIVQKFANGNIPLLEVIPYLAVFDFKMDSILFRNSQITHHKKKKKKKLKSMHT